MSEPENDNITIRDAFPQDLGHIVILLRQLWPSREISAASLEHAFRKSFSLGAHIIRVVIYKETIVGLCSLYIRNNLKAEGNLANIDELVVDDKMRNRQIGKMLLDDAERIALKHRCKFMGLESSFYREDAHRFYERNGYEKQGYYITRKIG